MRSNLEAIATEGRDDEIKSIDTETRDLALKLF